MKNIIIGSDHGGFELKEDIKKYLSSIGFNVTDIGTNSRESCDYPIFAKEVCNRILAGEFKRGILFCGTGLGMQICANRFKGIRAVCFSDIFSARMSREHNDSNVLCLGNRVLGSGMAQVLVDIWLNTEFEGGRHQRRLDMID